MQSKENAQVCRKPYFDKVFWTSGFTEAMKSLRQTLSWVPFPDELQLLFLCGLCRQKKRINYHEYAGGVDSEGSEGVYSKEVLKMSQCADILIFQMTLQLLLP